MKVGLAQASHREDTVFRAIADPTRRAILNLLRSGSRPVKEIASGFSVSRPAISKHLRLLRKARLVGEHRQGRNRFYHLNPDPLADIDHWLGPYRTFWQVRLDRLKTYVESRQDQPGDGRGAKAAQPDGTSKKGEQTHDSEH
ncbi:MAG: ArsR/SmtB family transcription factor [Acidobacteriota bacterium]